jgi:hypothetical protein
MITVTNSSTHSRISMLILTKAAISKQMIRCAEFLSQTSLYRKQLPHALTPLHNFVKYKSLLNMAS